MEKGKKVGQPKKSKSRAGAGGTETRGGGDPDASKKDKRGGMLSRLLTLKRQKKERRRVSAAEKLDINVPIIVKLIVFLQHSGTVLSTSSSDCSRSGGCLWW